MFVLKIEPKIAVALVHNKDPQRRAAIYPGVDSLLEVLSSRGQLAVYIESAYQAPRRAHSLRLALFRDFLQQTLIRRWDIYRLYRPAPLPRHAWRFLRSAFLERRYSAGSRWRYRSAVELAVTAKHLRVWDQFLESDAEFLLSFEDDAIFQEGSLEGICRLVSFMGNCRGGDHIYVDLAGGCRHRDLRVDKLESCHDGAFRHYMKPVTNTTCTYFMSRSLIALCHDEVARKPLLRLLPIDWLLNQVFIYLEKSGVDCACMHADPVLFAHGSAVGHYESSARV